MWFLTYACEETYKLTDMLITTLHVCPGQSKKLRMDFTKQGIDRPQKETKIIVFWKVMISIMADVRVGCMHCTKCLPARGEARVFFTVGVIRVLLPSFAPIKFVKFGTLICSFQCIMTATKSLVRTG